MWSSFLPSPFVYIFYAVLQTNTKFKVATIMRVFIYGSCVTRDAVPWFSEYGFDMVGYVARQSLISAFRKASTAEFDFTLIKSTFQRRMAIGDIEGNLRFAVQQSKPDVVLWDICDERLGVRKPRNGGMITHTRDYVGEGIHPGPFGPVMQFGTDEHYTLWERALGEFLLALDRYGLAGKLYLNATPWAVEDEFGRANMAQAEVAADFNRAADRYLDLARRQGVHVVVIPQDAAISRSDGHQWGPAPFHYADRTYQSMLKELHRSMATS